MTDFNPNTRDRADFFVPVQSRTWLINTVNFLTSILTTPTKIRGIDVSHWNGEIDFVAVKASGIDFVIIKCTEGNGFLDPKWHRNWQAAIDAGLIVMPYHFFRGNYKGSAQLQWFLQNAKEYLEEIEDKTILWWDVETSDGVSVTTRQNRLLGACTNTVSRGLQTGYYSNKNWETLIGNPAWVNDFWQWPAHWTPADYPSLPRGWTKEKSIVWQNGIYPTYSWVEPVEGAGKVDHNYFFGTLQQLRDLLGYTVVLPPNCCDEIEKIKSELIIIKSRLAQGELDNLDHEARLVLLEVGETALDERLHIIETKLGQVSKILD